MNSLEQTILSDTILDREAFEIASDIIKPEHFKDERNQILFSIITELYRIGVDADMISIFNAVDKRGLTNKITSAYITETASYSNSSYNIRYNCHLLYEDYAKREVAKKWNKFENTIKNTNDVFETIDEFASGLKEITAITSETDGDAPIDKDLEEYFVNLNKERKGEIEVGLKSNTFPTFNRTEGLRPGNVITISGKYKSGKTTFALALALDFALQNKSIGVISLEMGKESEVYPKLISMATATRYGYLRNPSHKGEHGNISYNDERFYETLQKSDILKDKKIYVADKTFTANKIEQLIRMWKNKKNIEMVVIDYIGLVDVPQKERRDLEIAAFSRKLKLLAKELEIIIIAISQENNESQTADSKGLARDSDYWFSVSKPINEKEKSIKVIKNGIEYSITVDNSLFKIILKEARHVESGWQFLCTLQRNGRFVELDVEHQEMYQENIARY